MADRLQSDGSDAGDFPYINRAHPMIDHPSEQNSNG